MSVAFELEYETCRPQLYVLPDQPAPTAPSPRVRRRRVVLGAVVVLGLLVLLALPIRAFGGSTLAQAAPSPGPGLRREVGRHAGVHRRAGQTRPGQGALTQQLAREVGSSVVVPGEHVFIP